MGPTTSNHIPNALRFLPEETGSGHYQLVDERGTVWAKGVPCAAAAQLFAATPQLLREYDCLIAEAHACFRLRWSLEFGDPDFWEFVEDEGELDARFPGAPAYANWLQDLCDLSEALKVSVDEIPVERDVDLRNDLIGPPEA